MKPTTFRYLTISLFWCIAILYFLAIDLKGIWIDEGYRFILFTGGQTWEQFNQSGSPGSFSDVLRVLGPEPYQPLFHLIINAVMRITRSHADVLLRMVNVMWLMFSLQGLLRLFRNYEEWTRLFALLVFALNGYMLMHVMQIREYPMYVAFMIWSSCMLFELLDMPDDALLKRWWPKLLGYGALMALLFYSHPYGIFALAAQFLMLFSRKGNRGRFLRLAAFSYAFAALLVLPWVVRVLQRPTQKTGMGVWDGRQPTFSLLTVSLVDGFRNLLTYNLWSGHPILQLFVFLVGSGVTIAWIAAIVRKQQLDRRGIYALLTMLFYFCFQVAYFFLKEPLSVWPRYFIAYYYGYVVLSTCAFSALWQWSQKHSRSWPKTLPFCVIVLVSAAGLTQYRLYAQDPFLDTAMTAECNYRTMARKMSTYIKGGETVAYFNSQVSWTIGMNHPFSTQSISFGEILEGKAGGRSPLWVFDAGMIPGEGHLLANQVISRLSSDHYSNTETEDLGCDCRLLRMESKEVGLWPAATGVSTSLAKSSDAPLVSFERLGEVSPPFSNRKRTVVSSEDKLEISGWAADPITKTSGSAVDVVIDGHAYAANYGVSRPDVSAAFSVPAYKNSGFVAIVGSGKVPRGVHHIAVRVIAPDARSYLESANYEFTVQ